MKINSVKVENILRVKFAEIEFKDDVVVIGGENWQGKSSVRQHEKHKNRSSQL